MIREMMCLLALAGVMAGCTNDGSSELQRPETTIRLTAELQQGSRTVLGDDGLKVLWENQDRLGVFSDKGDANVSFLLSEGAGESVGRFEGALSKGAVPQYVYYPYSADAGTSTATLAVTVDAEQTQNGTTASIGANDFKIGSYDAAQKRFSFRNKLSLLAFTVDDLTGSELFGQPLDRDVPAEMPGADLVVLAEHAAQGTARKEHRPRAFLPADARLLPEVQRRARQPHLLPHSAAPHRDGAVRPAPPRAEGAAIHPTFHPALPYWNRMSWLMVV